MVSREVDVIRTEWSACSTCRVVSGLVLSCLLAFTVAFAVLKPK